ncbi:MAG: SRPBCC domain-containing protein [Anaerolineae bacterium]|jgi:uncharacterized protein YndB with AHSA1/START domain
MEASTSERVIRETVTVDAPIDAVWDVWTTETGIRSFFAPAGNVGLRVGGPYEILFDPDAPPGERGAEGMRVLAFQPKAMLSFTWTAPPHLSEVRGQLTHVLMRLRKLADGRTQVTLTHSGWGEGGQWDEAFEYFERAWRDVVLPRLRYRFAVGPVDWTNPPRLSADSS